MGLQAIVGTQDVGAQVGNTRAKKSAEDAFKPYTWAKHETIPVGDDEEILVRGNPLPEIPASPSSEASEVD